MLSRRNFIRIGTASLGTLALRRFAEIPALAQTASDYRALVCVFLYGGNDSNNTIVPMDDASYKAYLAARGSLAIQSSALTQVQSAAGAPYGFFAPLAEVASMFGSKELAVVANVGSLVQPINRAQYQAAQVPVPSNLFSHADQQQQWQSSVAQGNSPTGWGGRAGGLCGRERPEFLEIPDVPFGGREHAGRVRGEDADAGDCARRIAGAGGVQQFGRVAGQAQRTHESVDVE